MVSHKTAVTDMLYLIHTERRPNSTLVHPTCFVHLQLYGVKILSVHHRETYHASIAGRISASVQGIVI